MSEEIRRPFVAPVADRHARPLETAGLRRACLATLIAQFGLEQLPDGTEARSGDAATAVRLGIRAIHFRNGPW